MNDIDKIIELGKQFAEPWKKATKILSVLFVILVLSLVFVVYNSGYVTFDANYNYNSEVSQTKD